MRTLAIIFCMTVVVGVAGCSSSKKAGPIIETYTPAYRQLPPEPVYSRLTWSQMPGPIKPKARENTPILMPELQFELPKSTLGEAIEALAQTIGYTWSYPSEAAKRPIAIKMNGTVEDILREISRQASVYSVLDHKERAVKVVSKSMLSPEAPQAKLPGTSS